MIVFISCSLNSSKRIFIQTRQETYLLYRPKNGLPAKMRTLFSFRWDPVATCRPTKIWRFVYYSFNTRLDMQISNVLIFSFRFKRSTMYWAKCRQGVQSAHRRPLPTLQTAVVASKQRLLHHHRTLAYLYVVILNYYYYSKTLLICLIFVGFSIA